VRRAHKYFTMSHFHESQTEADLPPWHRGEEIPSEVEDTALTTWLDARQPVLEPVEALLGGIHADHREETGE
jgi:hypothetical protein